MRPMCPVKNSLFGCSLETKLPWVLESSETGHAKIKLSFETKVAILHSLYNILQIFQNTFLLDMVSGRIDESHVSTNEEQEVLAGFTIEEIGVIQQAHQTQQETMLALQYGLLDQRVF